MNSLMHNYRWFSPLLLLVILSSSLAACSETEPKSSSNKSEVELIKSSELRQTEPTVPQSDLEKLVSGNSRFTFNLYQALRDDDENLFFSPFSISIALAMTYAGAREQTETQMAETLHYYLPQTHLHPAFNYLDMLLNPLNSTGSQEEKAFQLNIANSLWGQKDYPFLPGFLDVIAMNYGSGLRLVDFIPEDRREEARLAINEWVGQQTEQKILELIEEDILTEYTRLVLANAIYFMGDWKDPFLSGTNDDTFYLLDGSSTVVPMMSRRVMTDIVQGDGFQVIVLPYKGDSIEMVVLLPDSGEFNDFETSLDADRFNNMLTNVQSFDVRLSMPKFEYETSLKLEKTLAGMGMPDAFHENLANFTGMYDFDQVGRNLFIAHIIHKAYIAVDEKGTEAAAATGVVAEDESLPMEIRIDRPFIFLIKDNQTGTILFIGRLIQP